MADDNPALTPFPGHGAQVTEYMSFDDPSGDGEITVVASEEPDAPLLDEPSEQEPEPAEFYANLADGIIPDTILDTIAADLLTKVEEDKKAREARDKQYEEGIRRTGLGKDAPGGAEFEGASKTVHPMMTEACIDFCSRVMKELFPPTGPVKPNIIGEPTKEKVDRAKRKTDYMNHQFTTEIVEAFGVMETTMTQVPLGGCQYIKLWQDHRLKRPRMQFVPVDQVYIPFNATSWHAATRRTVAEPVSRVEFQHRIEQGQYRAIEIGGAPSFPDKTKSQEASDKVEGVEEPATNIDGVREIYETMEYLEVSEQMAGCLGFEEAGKLYPYLVSIDVETRKIVSLYRDWEQEDAAKREPIDHIFEFPFIPWRGAMAVGLPHIIGGLSAAATGALRGLLDSAHIQNTATGVVLKGSGTNAQTRRTNPGELTEIDSGLEADDIRKRVMPFPHNGPSPVLFQLLEFVVEAAKGTVRTSMDEAATVNANSPVPVGTQLSRVEEGMVVFSQIHNREHNALDRLIRGLHRLNRLYLDDEVRADTRTGEILVFRKDFEGSPDVMPVSDPNIYSDQQRMNQIGAIQARQAVVPNLYKGREIELAFLRLLKWPDPEQILVDQPEPHELNAPNECIAMLMGRPVIAFPDQNHLAHIQVHMDFMKSPLLGANPMIAPVFLPAVIKHIRDHFGYFYLSHLIDLVTKEAGLSEDQLHSDDTQVKSKLDELFATASPRVIAQLEQTLGGTMPFLQAAMQQVKAMTPPPPMDPATAAVQAAQAETERKGKQDTAGNQVKMAQIQAEKDDAQLQAQTKVATTQLDNQTALQIAGDKAEAGQSSGFSDGESLKGE